MRVLRVVLAVISIQLYAAPSSGQIEVEVGKEAEVAEVKWPPTYECKGQSPIFDVQEHFPQDFRRDGKHVYFRPSSAGLQNGSVRVGYYYQDMVSCSMGVEVTEFSAVGVLASSVSHKQALNPDVLVWPSISSSRIHFACTMCGKENFIFTDMLGRVIASVKSDEREIDISDWPSGHYLVRHAIAGATSHQVFLKR